MLTHVVTSKYRGKREYFLAYSALVAAAHSRSFLTYAGIAHLTGLPTSGQAMGKAVGHLVGEISEDEHLAKRPLLSALVVDKSDGTPSFGFYNLVEKLGLLSNASENQKRQFKNREQTKLFTFYATKPTS